MGERSEGGLSRIIRNPLVSVPGIFVAGIVFWGGFNTSLEITNTESFCISCHEMRDNVYREYRETIHFTNRTGVRATCPDCHVPREWGPKVVRKVGATNELYHKVRGSIDTPQKFRAKRLELARKVWRSMAQTDSRECRNCHSFVSMDLGVQNDVAEKRHRQSAEQGKTCIDCHKGIAHELPEEFLEAEHDRFERENVACADCHKGMAQAPSDEEWDWNEND